jgi:hypothetical protein
VTPLAKGLALAAIHAALVAALGAKFVYDRAHFPRLWVETAPYDPDLPVRGRYVRIALVVEANRAQPKAGDGNTDAFVARLEARDGRLFAVEDEARGRHWVRECNEGRCWQLSEPLAYFIPEHAPDPSVQPGGSSLWAEVTLPPTGAPRPIRLGVKKGEGAIEPIGS